MGKEISASAFDYSELDKDVKGKLLCIAREITQAKKQHAASGMVIGESVAMAHSLLAKDGRDGKFSQWVESECGFSRRSAYNYMNAWQRFGNCATVAQFDDGALYALSEPAAPEKAVKEAVKLADSGHKITLDKAKELLDRFRDVAARGRSSTNKKALSQSDMPPTPAEDEPPQAESISTDNANQTAVKVYDDTFNAAELASESKDAFGDESPEELSLAFQLREGFKEQRNKLSSIKAWMTQNENHPGAAVLAGARERILADLKNADSELKFSAPYCVCVYCKNKPPKVANCNACKGLGWITEQVYKAAPKGMQRASA